MLTLPSRAAIVSLAVAVLSGAGAATAAAAGEPQITAAGIDAEDQVVVTWQLAPGTSFEALDVNASPILDRSRTYPDFADIDSFAGFECAPPPKSCSGSPTQTSYRGTYNVPRDRRYFVLVTARSGDDLIASPVWVIDETKPLIPGDWDPPDTITHSPVLGHLYVPPAPETIPAPTLSLPAPTPKTIAGFLHRGIRARLTCPVFECYGAATLERGGDGEFAERTLRPGGRHTFVLRASKRLRARLRGHSRARLRLSLEVTHPGGKRTDFARTITLRG